MSTSITAHYTEIFDEILALDLSSCAITVCLASVVKDEAPRFARLQITEELATGFRDIIRNLYSGSIKRDKKRGCCKIQ